MNSPVRTALGGSGFTLMRCEVILYCKTSYDRTLRVFKIDVILLCPKKRRKKKEESAGEGVSGGGGEVFLHILLEFDGVGIV